MGSNVIATVSRLTHIFEAHCEDVETLLKLREATVDRAGLRTAKGIFEKIRRQTLRANEREDKLSATQYRFEEVCAKTLYNVTGPSAPFDPYVPFCILPNALVLSRMLALADADVISTLFEGNNQQRETGSTSH